VIREILHADSFGSTTHPGYTPISSSLLLALSTDGVGTSRYPRPTSPSPSRTRCAPAAQLTDSDEVLHSATIAVATAAQAETRIVAERANGSFRIRRGSTTPHSE
jgi:hypothetical protein